MADHTGTQRIHGYCEGTPYPVRSVIRFGANILLAHADADGGAKRWGR